MCQGQSTTLSAVGKLDAQLGILFAEAVLALLAKEGLSAQDITAIGCHGQTVWHEPLGEPAFTMQLGDNNRIAAMTQIATVGISAVVIWPMAGRGPLVPAFHHALLAHATENVWS